MAKPKFRKPEVKSGTVEDAHDLCKVTVLEEKFARAYIEGRTRNATEAYIECGGSPNGARQSAARLLTQPGVRQYLSYLRAEAEVQPIDVLRVLSKQMHNSIEDFLDDEGQIDLRMARERGVLDQVKSISCKQSGILKIELYSSQSAAIALSKCLGIEQQPRMNDEDSARIKQHIEAEVKRLMEKYEWDREQAMEFVKEAAPASAKYLM
jgi:Terminase small subunit